MCFYLPKDDSLATFGSAFYRPMTIFKLKPWIAAAGYSLFHLLGGEVLLGAFVKLI